MGAMIIAEPAVPSQRVRSEAFAKDKSNPADLLAGPCLEKRKRHLFPAMFGPEA